MNESSVFQIFFDLDLSRLKENQRELDKILKQIQSINSSQVKNHVQSAEADLQINKAGFGVDIIISTIIGLIASLTIDYIRRSYKQYKPDLVRLEELQSTVVTLRRQARDLLREVEEIGEDPSLNDGLTNLPLDKDIILERIRALGIFLEKLKDIEEDLTTFKVDAGSGTSSNIITPPQRIPVPISIEYNYVDVIGPLEKELQDILDATSRITNERSQQLSEVENAYSNLRGVLSDTIDVQKMANEEIFRNSEDLNKAKDAFADIGYNVDQTGKMVEQFTSTLKFQSATLEGGGESIELFNNGMNILGTTSEQTAEAVNNAGEAIGKFGNEGIPQTTKELNEMRNVVDDNTEAYQQLQKTTEQGISLDIDYGQIPSENIDNVYLDLINQTLQLERFENVIESIDKSTHGFGSGSLPLVNDALDEMLDLMDQVRTGNIETPGGGIAGDETAENFKNVSEQVHNAEGALNNFNSAIAQNTNKISDNETAITGLARTTREWTSEELEAAGNKLIEVNNTLAKFGLTPEINLPSGQEIEEMAEGVERGTEASKGILDEFGVYAANVVANISQNFGDLIFETLKGNFDSLGDFWDATLDSMLKSFSDLVAVKTDYSDEIVDITWEEMWGTKANVVDQRRGGDKIRSWGLGKTDEVNDLSDYRWLYDIDKVIYAINEIGE